MAERKPLILIDGSSWLYRAFHALPANLTAPDGTPTGAVLVMGNMLRKLLREYQPDNIAVIFDPPGKTFRNDLYADYKANRPPVPPDLKSQFPIIQELLNILGLPVIQVSGVEADDVIGTLAMQAAAEQRDTLVVTGDKDMAQLVNDHITLLDTMKNKVMDRDAVIEKFAVPPERIIDLLALMGDSSDNIPGIPKVGPKTAAKWLNQYGTLEDVVENADDVGGKIGETLRAHLDQLPRSKDLATIRCDLALDTAIDALVPGEADHDKLIDFCQRMGFTRWLTELEASDETGEKTTAAASSPQPAADYHTVLTQADFDAMLKALQQAELICVDSETDSLDFMQANIVGLSFAIEPGKAWYVPVAHDYMGAPDQLDRDAVLAALKPLLEDAGKPKVGQHLKYDMNVLARYDIQVQGVAHDTMLESYVFNSTATRHDMDSLASLYLNQKTIKFEEIAGKGKKQLTFNQIDLEQAAPYAAEDADVTLRLHQAIWPQLSETASLKKLYSDIEIPLVPVLSEIERNGVMLDRPALEKLNRELEGRLAELEKQAHEQAGGEFNLNSATQLREILFDRLGLPVGRKTPGGQPSTNEEVLNELADEHALPATILEHRELAKIRSTYTETLIDKIDRDTGRVHTSYHQAVAATGRLSSSDPNLQNIPIRSETGRRIRQAFVAPEGASLLAIDYSQIELRLMAHLSEDPGLIEAFEAGEDVHRATAAEVFGVARDAVSDEQRRAAKAINFGLMYGMSAFGLARQLKIGREESARYIEVFFERYPGVRAYMDNTRESARSTGYVETLFGRRLYLRDINARNAQHRQYAERTAINAPLQGSAADLIKLAMLDCHAWLKANANSTRMIMQVHDELVFEGETEEIRTIADTLVERMCAVTTLRVPLLADYGIGSNWDEAH